MPRCTTWLKIDVAKQQAAECHGDQFCEDRQQDGRSAGDPSGLQIHLIVSATEDIQTCHTRRLNACYNWSTHPMYWHSYKNDAAATTPHV